MINYIGVFLILAALIISCGPPVTVPTTQNERPANTEQTNTIRQDIQESLETCTNLQILYETGLNEENRKARELYLGKGSITLTRDAILEESFDLPVPDSTDYSAFYSLYKYAELVNLYDFDEIPLEITEQEYLALKELEWSRYYLDKCKNIKLAFD